MQKTIPPTVQEEKLDAKLTIILSPELVERIDLGCLKMYGRAANNRGLFVRQAIRAYLRHIGTEEP